MPNANVPSAHELARRLLPGLEHSRAVIDVAIRVLRKYGSEADRSVLKRPANAQKILAGFDRVN